MKICSHAIHLINKDNSWDFVFIRLTPNGLGLRLHSGNSTEDNNRTIKNSKRTLYLCGKVDMARSIDDIDALLLTLKELEDIVLGSLRPITGNCSGLNRNPPLALLLHVVGSSRTIMNLAETMNHSCVEKNSLRQRCLPRVDMRSDPDVARMRQRECTVRTVGV